MTETLHVVPGVSVRVRASDAEVEGPAGRVVVRLEGLFDLLSRFEGGASVREVLASTPAHGALDWLEQSVTLHQLVGAGVLAQEAVAAPRTAGFGTPAIHVKMLHDTQRVLAYLRALQELVRPDDVVVDLGTGTGILAVAAARAGARHVYAIEESAIGDTAEEVFAANGLGDRITLVRGHSTRVELPERGTLLVTETLGNDPIDEGILPFVADARRRLLAPDARVMPSALDVVLRLVEAQTSAVLSAPAVEGWRRAYGIELGPLLARHRSAIHRFIHDPRTLAPCSEPACVEHLRLDADAAATFEGAALLRATRSAANVGVAVGYDAHLSPGVRLEVGTPGRASSWSPTIHARLEPMPVSLGSEVRVRLSRSRTKYRIAFD